MLQAGANRLGDSRIENIEAMRRAGVDAPMSLIRSPMVSQVERVVAQADTSFNAEPEVVRRLSAAAQAAGRVHGVVLMVELGDLREGLMPGDLESAVQDTLRLPNIVLEGIGSNLACRSGVKPDARNMAELSGLANSIERTFGVRLETVSGGNSGNLGWALGESGPGRVNDLRLGEAILLGCEPLQRQPVAGLCPDAITLIAEVIETKLKPSLPWGDRGQSAFGAGAADLDRGPVVQSIVALGHQDTDPLGLGLPQGFTMLGASGDHLIISSRNRQLAVGEEVAFQLNYSALVRAMTSPFVARVIKGDDGLMR